MFGLQSFGDTYINFLCFFFALLFSLIFFVISCFLFFIIYYYHLSVIIHHNREIATFIFQNTIQYCLTLEYDIRHDKSTSFSMTMPKGGFPRGDISPRKSRNHSNFPAKRNISLRNQIFLTNQNARNRFASWKSAFNSYLNLPDFSDYIFLTFEMCTYVLFKGWHVLAFYYQQVLVTQT